ncbi:MAG TPA: hypothetical protein PK339_12645 [Flavitalea sp.]|nr:hypothetical protein [Flavitalea sp.]
MTFHETVSAIITWTDASTTKEQLNLMRDVVDRFLRERFRYHVSNQDMCTAEMNISNAINDKEYALEFSAEQASL